MNTKRSTDNLQTAVLSVTTFWSLDREFPREGLNWSPVHTVSRGQSPQTDVRSAEIAIWQQFAQRRVQLG